MTTIERKAGKKKSNMKQLFEVDYLKEVKDVLSGADFLWFRPKAIFAVPRNIISTSFL